MKKTSTFLAASLLTLTTTTANSATFEIIYDDTPNNEIGNIVGYGTFSYDGPVQFGSFSLDSLTNLAFYAEVGGNFYTIDDLLTVTSESGITVFNLGGGSAGLVFTGEGGYQSGSFDLDNGNDYLTHEPTDSISERTGCCGGDGTINYYMTRDYYGDYQATSVAAIPEPSTYALMAGGLSLVGFMAMRRRKQLQ